MNSKSWISRLTNEADMVQYNIHSTELKGFSKCLEIIDICLSAWHKFFTIEIKRDIEELHRNGDKLQSGFEFEKYINRIKKYGQFIVRKNNHSLITLHQEKLLKIHLSLNAIKTQVNVV